MQIHNSAPVSVGKRFPPLRRARRGAVPLRPARDRAERDRMERLVREAYVGLGDAVGRKVFGPTQARRITEAASGAVNARPWGKVLDYLYDAVDAIADGRAASALEVTDVTRVLDAMRACVVARWRQHHPLRCLATAAMRETEEQSDADVAVLAAMVSPTLPAVEAALKEAREHRDALDELIERLEVERAHLLKTGRPTASAPRLA